MLRKILGFLVVAILTFCLTKNARAIEPDEDFNQVYQVDTNRKAFSLHGTELGTISSKRACSEEAMQEVLLISADSMPDSVNADLENELQYVFHSEHNYLHFTLCKYDMFYNGVRVESKQLEYLVDGDSRLIGVHRRPVGPEIDSTSIWYFSDEDEETLSLIGQVVV